MYVPVPVSLCTFLPPGTCRPPRIIRGCCLAAALRYVRAGEQPACNPYREAHAICPPVACCAPNHSPCRQTGEKSRAGVEVGGHKSWDDLQAHKEELSETDAQVSCVATEM